MGGRGSGRRPKTADEKHLRVPHTKRITDALHVILAMSKGATFVPKTKADAAAWRLYEVGTVELGPQSSPRTMLAALAEMMDRTGKAAAADLNGNYQEPRRGSYGDFRSA
jgi:hypothetical protein